MIPTVLRRWGVWLVLLTAVAWLVLCPEDALARVGGGQGFSSGGGGGSSGGGGGSGGGGDGLGLILYFIIRLCIEYPAVGFPLLGLLIGFVVLRGLFQRHMWAHQVHRTRQAIHPGGPTRARNRQASGLALLKDKDPILSIPVLHEYLQLVHRRALQAATTHEWEPLAPFVAVSVHQDLSRSLPDVVEVSEVVHGGIRIERVQHVGQWVKLVVVYLGSRQERTRAGAKRVFFQERWHFQRAAAAVSLPPDDVMRMGCPSCGSAIDTDRLGRCSNCETPITRGQLTWQATQMSLMVKRSIQPPEVGASQGGDEPSVRQGTVVDPHLAAELRKFGARHPDFDRAAFDKHVRTLFMELQRAWSDNTWERARPHVTDPMFQNLRFYMEQYAEGGLRNKLDDVEFERMEIVKVELDAWYEAITVRLWASMKDYVVDGSGAVIGGNAKVSRHFSEYWTFLRAAGTGADTKDAFHCPSCGAELDQVNQAGVCGYCSTRITSGRFDWVLSRIDQVEVYQG